MIKSCAVLPPPTFSPSRIHKLLPYRAWQRIKKQQQKCTIEQLTDKEKERKKKSNVAGQEKLACLSSSSNWNILIRVTQMFFFLFLPEEPRSGPLKPDSGFPHAGAQIWAVFRDYQRDHRSLVLKVKPWTRPQTDIRCSASLAAPPPHSDWISNTLSATCSSGTAPASDIKERLQPSVTSLMEGRGLEKTEWMLPY